MKRLNPNVTAVAAGLSSAMLGVVFDRSHTDFARLEFLSIGAVFGAALCVCFAIYEPGVTWGKVSWFVCASTLAYLVAFFLVFGLSVLFGGTSMGSGQNIPMPVFVLSGCAGGLILGAARVFVFVPERRVVVGTRALLFRYAIAGGVLGVLGAGADAIRTNGIDNDFVDLNFIWQTGMALVLTRGLNLQLV
jgi:hypothetical protein